MSAVTKAPRLVSAATQDALPTPGRALTEDWYVECVDFKDPDKDKIGKYVFFSKLGYVPNTTLGLKGTVQP